MQDEKHTSSDVEIELCKNVIAEYYDLHGSGVKKLHSYSDLNFHLQPPVFRGSDNSDDDVWPHGYVFKIMNSEQSENVAFVEEYIKVLLHLRKGKIITSSVPIKNKYGNYYSYWTNPSEGGRRIIIMLCYQDGEELLRHRCNGKIAVSMGQLMSDLHLQLEPFCHHAEVFKRPDFSWNLESVPNLRNVLDKIRISKHQKSSLVSVIDEFENKVLAKLDHLEIDEEAAISDSRRFPHIDARVGHSVHRHCRHVLGIIHNDFHHENLLVRRLSDEESDIEFIGVLDFTDMVYTAYLFEIAITACYLCFYNPEDSVNLTASLVAGYHRRRLTHMEYGLLKICICARFVQSLVKGLYAHFLDPSNPYALQTQETGWKLLNFFRDMDNEYFVDRIRQLAATEETTV